uniref:Uncharacterized protein n=1 Tax=Anguilla anguilla TaxID=7936 RepID=A0A0E9U482_ANGAN
MWRVLRFLPCVFSQCWPEFT